MFTDTTLWRESLTHLLHIQVLASLPFNDALQAPYVRHGAPKTTKIESCSQARHWRSHKTAREPAAGAALVKLFQIGNSAYIPLHDGSYVIPRPCLASLWIFTPQHLGVAADQHGLY